MKVDRIGVFDICRLAAIALHHYSVLSSMNVIGVSVLLL